LRIEGYAFSDCSSLSSICLPAALLEVLPGAFNGANLEWISIEEGNLIFKLRDHFLVDFDGTTIIKCFGRAEGIIIPADIETLGCYCFSGNRIVSSVSFEPDSKLSRIESDAFRCCSSLSSLFIPSSVEVLGRSCFFGCHPHLSVTFDPGSKLSSVPPECWEW
jgi:hypothetical protein